MNNCKKCGCALLFSKGELCIDCALVIGQIKYETVTFHNEVLNEKEMLKTWGEGGWRLCSVVSTGDCMTKYYFCKALAEGN